MSIQHSRRLLVREEVLAMLQLPDDEVQQLINTARFFLSGSPAKSALIPLTSIV